MAIVLHNSGSQGASNTVNGAEATNLALKIRAVPDRYLVFSIAFRSNTSSVTNVRWQPAGTTTGEQSLTFLGARNHATDALRVELWGLLNPTPSSAASSRVVWVASVTTGSRAAYAATCYQGVDQTTPYAGYPSTPTNFQTDSGATLTSPLGETTGITLTTVVGDIVVDVFGSDAAASTNNFNSTTGGMVPNARTLLSNPVTSGIRFGTAQLTATGTSTSMKWRSYGGGTSAFGSGQSGRQYVHAGFSLQATVTTAPYWVRPPNEVVAAGSTTASGIRFVSIADWPTAGSIALAQTVGPTEWGTTINLLTKQFTAHTNTTITGASTYAGTMTMMDTALYAMIAGDGQTQLGTGTIILYIPGTAEADDVILIDVYSENATVSAATFASAGSPTATAIQSQTTGGFTHTLLYKRLTAADVTASSITITFSATPTWRTAAAQIYRGCITSGDPYVTAGDGAPTLNSGTGTTLTITGVTTPAANHTVYFSAAKFDGNPAWTLPNASDSLAERTRWFNIWQGERPMHTAGATGNQAVTINSTGWSAMAITLIPNASGTPYTRSVTEAAFADWADALSRAGSAWKRTNAESLVISNDTVSRAGSAWKRTNAETGFAYGSDAFTRVISRAKTILENGFAWTSSSDSLSRAGSAWKRTAADTRAFVNDALTFVLSSVPSTPHIRAIVENGFAFSNDAVSRAGSAWKRAITSASAAWTATSDTLFRTVAYKRSNTESLAFSNDAVSRAGSAWKRTVTDSGFGWTASSDTFTFVKTTVGVSFFKYVANQSTTPVYQTFEDLSTSHPGVTFYFEAQLASSVNSAAYADLYDLTAGAVVAGSQVVTSSPHTTSQVVRSSAINLVSGHVYYARIGRGAGYLVEPPRCTIIARDVA